MTNEATREHDGKIAAMLALIANQQGAINLDSFAAIEDPDHADNETITLESLRDQVQDLQRALLELHDTVHNTWQAHTPVEEAGVYYVRLLDEAREHKANADTLAPSGSPSAAKRECSKFAEAFGMAEVARGTMVDMIRASLL